MYEYEHTQKGTLLRYLMGAVVLALTGMAVFLWTRERTLQPMIPVAFVSLVIGVALALFHSLTVRVNRDTIEVSFGIGLIHTAFQTKDIRSAKVVQNRWYHGWGIRKIIGGWLYNVSGFDAVELEYEGDRRYRIGTDEPEKLHAAIERVLEKG